MNEFSLEITLVVHELDSALNGAPVRDFKKSQVLFSLLVVKRSQGSFSLLDLGELNFYCASGKHRSRNFFHPSLSLSV